MQDRQSHPKAGARCPACGKPRDPRFRPFCSARCRDRDLLQWLNGAYAIPVVDDEADSESAQDAALDRS